MRKLTASSTRHASLAAGEVDDRRDRRQVRVVEQHRAADADVAGEVPPVEDRIRKAVRAVDEDEVERPRLPAREHLVGRADAEGDAARASTPSSAQRRRMRSSSPGSGVTATWFAPAAAKTIVLARRPVSSVDHPGSTFRSSHSSAAHARPQNSSAPWRPGGADAERDGDGGRGHRRALCVTRPGRPAETVDAYTPPAGCRRLAR